MTLVLAKPSGGGSLDQNLWETIISDSGSVAANTPTDSLTIAGGTNASTSISGDTLTIDVPLGAGLDFGTSGQIPFMQADGLNFDYSANLVFDAPNNRLGIGTNTPIKELHVEGEIIINSFDRNNPFTLLQMSKTANFGGQYMTVFSNTSSQYPFLQFQKSHNNTLGTLTTTLDGEALAVFFAVGVNSSNQFRTGAGWRIFQDGTAGALVPTRMQFEVATSTAGLIPLTIRSTGNIGIMNTVPASRLEIKGAGTTSTTSSLNVTDSAGTSLLFVRDDGKVGIGTNNPSVELDIVKNQNALTVSNIKNSTTGTASRAAITVTSDGTGTLNFQALSTAFTPNGMLAPDTAVFQSTMDNGLNIGTFSAGANKQLSFWTVGVERMKILSTGEVGIGTTSPSATLDLVGTLQYVDGNEAANSILTGDAAGDAVWNDTPTLAGITISGRFHSAAPTSVASADEITLGDSNSFDITGTTTINHINNTDWSEGDKIRLFFSTSLTVTHDAATPTGTEASMKLAGSVDFSATAGDNLSLEFHGGFFEETSRTAI